MNFMRINDEEKHNLEKGIISEIMSSLRQLSIHIKNSDLPVKHQLVQIDVLVELAHFLANYEENKLALKDYYLHRKHKSDNNRE